MIEVGPLFTIVKSLSFTMKISTSWRVSHDTMCPSCHSYPDCLGRSSSLMTDDDFAASSVVAINIINGIQLEPY